ncbi:hypothetical protein FSHL1_002327 [Fusarium sambucinum]
MAGEPPEHQNKWQHVALGGSRWNPVQGLGSLWLSPLLTSKAQGHVWWLKGINSDILFRHQSATYAPLLTTHTPWAWVLLPKILFLVCSGTPAGNIFLLSPLLFLLSTPFQLLRSKSNYQHSTKRLVRDRHDSSRSNPEHIPSRRQWPHPKYAALNPRRDRARALS